MCGETTQKFGSNDPDDPVDGTVNTTITDRLAAGNKAAWKSSFGFDRPALGDAKSEIETSDYGKDLFPIDPEAKTRGIDPHRKQILPHRGLFDNSKGILENTISAADNALKHGFHGVELDLRADKSGHAWMMHDTTLGRVTGDPNNCLISDVPTEEIKNMNLSIWNPINNERIPALDRNGIRKRWKTCSTCKSSKRAFGSSRPAGQCTERLNRDESSETISSPSEVV
ncbi:glycerophosphodiester phosphodiesterase family protein [Bradyrhizobium barranii]|uniref:glycerophosphodiester phosphodiesterase family protein n=1 Tax=Bradyrhizobium barranii TaxID=2992140 RepID=UPI0024B16D69|nr:glycerophosphodiester phosphodiesterase family protein [Bradyrhizobium barranii]WFT96859.1 glycerophosphodiester phosphodiesterase family protein [Bradyrhizobium barranii]